MAIKIPVDVVRISQGQRRDQVMATYRRQRDVAYVEPNYRLHKNLIPNDPDFEELWGLHNTGQTGGTPGADIRITNVWASGITGSSDIIVAVIDTGIDYNHEDLAAPGSAIYSTVPNSAYDTYSGTSMATPHVAGVAALMLALNPNATPGQLKQALMDSVDVLPAWEGLTITGGRLNAAAALQALNPHFSIIGAPPLPFIIGTGESVTFEVIYRPVESGEHAGYVRIASNDTNAPVVDGVISGSAEDDALEETHDGVDAAQSGNITHNQNSWIETEVEGPGDLSFWWKVSSESNYDFLEFYINGDRRDRISGEVNWRQETYAIGEGPHTLRWRYMKDGSVDRGSDCGWLDQVVYIAESDDFDIEDMTMEIDLGQSPAKQAVSCRNAGETPAISGDAAVIIRIAGLTCWDIDTSK